MFENPIRKFYGGGTVEGGKETGLSLVLPRKLRRLLSSSDAKIIMGQYQLPDTDPSSIVVTPIDLFSVNGQLFCRIEIFASKYHGDLSTTKFFEPTLKQDLELLLQPVENQGSYGFQFGTFFLGYAT